MDDILVQSLGIHKLFFFRFTFNLLKLHFYQIFFYFLSFFLFGGRSVSGHCAGAITYDNCVIIQSICFCTFHISKTKSCIIPVCAGHTCAAVSVRVQPSTLRITQRAAHARPAIRSLRENPLTQWCFNLQKMGEFIGGPKYLQPQLAHTE